jgi:hypothetical protein
MPTPIIFNGQEYASTEAMPQAVRTAYQEAIAKLEDPDRNGVPGSPTLASVLPVVLAAVTGAAIVVGGWMIWQLDADLRSRGGGFYVGRGLLALVVLTSIAGIGIAIRMTLKRHGPPRTIATGGSAPEAQPSPPQAYRTEDFLRALDMTEHTLARVLQILLGVAAGGVVAGGVWMILHMDASSRSQAGDFFVGLGVLVALGCIAGIYISIEMGLKK